MIKWTTPSLKCKIPSIDCDYIILTLKQGGIILEKQIQSEDITDSEFTVFFTQEETGSFNKDITIEAQLNIIYGNTRLATNIAQLKITKNLHDEVINEQ